MEQESGQAAILAATNVPPEILSRSGSFEIARPPNMAPSATLYVAVLICLFSPLSFGFALAFTSPAKETMQFDHQSNVMPPPAGLVVFETGFQTSAFSAIINIGCMTGAFMGASISDRYGRKMAIAISAFPMLIAYPAIATWSNWMTLTCLRFLMGVGVGIGSAVAPCYIGEVSTLNLRGAFGAMNQLAITFGIFFANFFGTFVFQTGANSEFCEWRSLSLFGAALAICIWITIFIPESPRFFAMQGNLKKTRASLMSLREVSAAFDKELLEIINQTPALRRAAALENLEPGVMVTPHGHSSPRALEPGGMVLHNGSRPANVEDANSEDADASRISAARYRKSLIVGFGLLIFQQMSGCNAIIFYVSPICKDAGMSDPNLAGTFAMAAQVVFTGIACLVMDKAGRKAFILFSMAICSTSHVVLAIYFFAAAGGASPPSFIALAAISIYIIGFSFGLGPIPWLILAELFPTEVRGVASSMAITVNWAFSFAVTLLFDPVKQMLGSGTTFLLFGIIVCAGMLFTLFFVPETRGKNIEEVLMSLNGNSDGVHRKPAARDELLCNSS